MTLRSRRMARPPLHHPRPAVRRTDDQRRVDCLQLVPDMEASDIRPSNLQEYLASIRAASTSPPGSCSSPATAKSTGWTGRAPARTARTPCSASPSCTSKAPAAPASSASSPSGSAKSPAPSSQSSTNAPARSPATPACAPTATSRNPTSSPGASPPASCAASPELRPSSVPVSPPSPTGSPACRGPRSSGASPSPSSTQEPPAASPSTPGATEAPPTAAPAPSPSSTSPGPTGKSPSSATAGKTITPRAAGSRQGKTRRPPRRQMVRPDLLGRPDRPRRRRLRTRDHRRPESRLITGNGRLTRRGQGNSRATRSISDVGVNHYGDSSLRGRPGSRTSQIRRSAPRPMAGIREAVSRSVRRGWNVRPSA